MNQMMIFIVITGYSVIKVDENKTGGINREDLRKSWNLKILKAVLFGNLCICNQFLINIRITARELPKRCSKMVYVCQVDLIFLIMIEAELKRQFLNCLKNIV